MNKKNTFFLIILLGFLYYIFGLYSLTNSVETSIVTISPFFSEGFSLAFVLLFGPRILPGIFLGQLFLALHVNYPLFPSFLISISNSLEALLAFYILKKAKFNINLIHIKDIYLLIGIIFFILQPFSSLVGTFILYNFSIIDNSKILETIFSWYFGNILGQLLIAPTIIYLYNNFDKINLLKLIFISSFFAILCYSFIILIPVQNISILFSITILPLVFLLTYNLGLVYALFSIFVISLVSINTFQKGIGIFSIYSDINNIININFYILSHIIIILIIGVLMIEKNQTTKKYKRLNTLLEEKVKLEVLKNREKDKIMFFQSKMAQMGETIAMIAHQWRQPLNNLAILNQSLYIKYKKSDINEEYIDKFFKNSKEQIELMSKTIDDFKDFFQPNKEKTVFCINKTIVKLLNLTKPEFDKNNIYIQKDCFKEIYFKGYQNEFSQAILNILNNSKDALLEKQILDKKITISLDEDKNNIILIIKDNAKGIDKEIIHKIFEPYFSTKKRKNGTGLGLYMSKMIIEEHLHGKIDVSNDNEGAVFKITLRNHKMGGG